jgi:hypothetical protein
MKIEDYIFVETNDSCALCGQKGLSNLTKHHIDDDRNNGEYDNLLVLCRNCHCRFNEKKGITKKQIKETKRKLIIKTCTCFGVNALKFTERNKCGVIAMPFLLYHLVDLGLMKKKENQMGFESQDGFQKDAIARFTITPKGRDFYKKWLK